LGKFDLPTDRFSHIHLDLIGPLPESNGKNYCLTVIDRATRWPEAYPLNEITAQAVARTLLAEWISRFGCPEKITTDQGRQFEAELFRQLAQLLGAEKFRTSPYHPQSNGLIENWHRPLKCALKAKRTEKWTEVLPLVLLGFRAALKTDIQTSPAEMVFGTTLKLPGDFFDRANIIKSPEQLIQRLRDVFHEFQPTPTKSHHKVKPFVSQDFKTCTHVFVRNDGLRKSLQPPYDGPFPVVERSTKFFKIKIRGKNNNISLDRLKPAYIVDCEPASERIDEPVTVTTPRPRSTRSGRTVSFPSHLKDYYVH
jgi:cleavage and polyadenylation specificity factor subunit 1